MLQRHALCACVPVALCLAAGLAHGQPANGKHTVVATGTAVVKLRPDAARVTFYLTTLRGTIKDSRVENQRQVKALKDALGTLNIKALDTHISDAGLTLVTGIDRNVDAGQRIVGMQARAHVTLTVHASDADKLIDTVKKIVDVSIENGANATPPADDLIGPGFARSSRAASGPRIEFFSEKEAGARQQAIAEAVKDALANAKALAGGKIVPVETSLVSAGAAAGMDDITVPVSPLTGLPLRGAAAAAARTEPDAAPDVILVRATVRVTCAVQP